MPVAKRRPTPEPTGRTPWTKTRCLTARRCGETAAHEEARRSAFSGDKARIAFLCPYGDHWHVECPPAACVACDGAGVNSKGTGDCGPCKGTGVRT